MLSETTISNKQYYSTGSGINTQGFLKGIPSAVGIAIGKSFIIEPEPYISGNTFIEADKIQSEIERFAKALKHLNTEFDEVISHSKTLPQSAQTIIETYLYLINDEFINENIRERIKTGLDTESAVINEYDYQGSFLRNSKDDLLRERVNDLENVKRRFISTLRHENPEYHLASGKILVAQNISPTDLVKYKEVGVIGIITEMGGIASHVSILARSFEMPAIIGVKDATKVLTDGLDLIIDGFTGLIIYNPDNLLSRRYEQRISEIEEHKTILGKLVKVKTETSDKRRIHLLSNIDRLEDVKNALIAGAEGVGLVRTESLLSNSGKIPDEDSQYSWYNELAERMYPNIVTIRCFDIGSDKYSAGIPLVENNPSLGLRGVRFLLYSRDIFKSQIKAILRASVNKNVRIMIPMISDLSELLTSKSLIADCMLELDKSGIKYDSKIPVGIMIETPSAVLTSDILAVECDFFSIGTNDLTQYTLAADRTNDLVTDIYDSFHPSVLKMIKITIENATKAGIVVGICGELAGHSGATRLLMGLGITELSVPSSMLLELKNRILKINFEEAVQMTEKLLTLNSSHDILKILESESN
ncbi:MAG: phosphoenolpyruvate--protein phosphotransferase [Candidatus Kapabacteria bacterium]|nr:phosphoenolpyruvate--protein phosphotransferase [Ignavibacteriota bacterium]MCW5886424.1 phosphoenolpyruvate--protein phosphotransferase [Candidatus Kapabacteria bacterium]